MRKHRMASKEYAFPLIKKNMLSQISSPSLILLLSIPAHSPLSSVGRIFKRFIINPTELKGVLAHEIGHIKNRDILIQSVASSSGAAITYLAYIAMFTGIGGDDEEGG